MKKVLSLVVAAVLVTMATSAMAGLTIINSKHDLSKTSTSGGGYGSSNTTQVCVFCHTPHNAVVNRALWNRKAGVATSFSVYTSGANMENIAWYSAGQKNTLDAKSPSMLCLSCHDGQTTMGNISAKPGGVTPTFTSSGIITTSAALGADLTNDHPIGINYEAFRAGILPTNTTLVASAAGSVKNPVTNVLYPLANGVSVECNTCHSVHDSTFKPFLRDTMESSKLCTGCHIK